MHVEVVFNRQRIVMAAYDRNIVNLQNHIILIWDIGKSHKKLKSGSVLSDKEYENLVTSVGSEHIVTMCFDDIDHRDRVFNVMTTRKG